MCESQGLAGFSASGLFGVQSFRVVVHLGWRFLVLGGGLRVFGGLGGLRLNHGFGAFQVRGSGL